MDRVYQILKLISEWAPQVNGGKNPAPLTEWQHGWNAAVAVLSEKAKEAMKEFENASC